jgi:nitroreductase
VWYRPFSMDVFEAIRLRRSIKPEKMKSDPVDRTLLDRMFEAARWAPTHGMTEPWRYVVFEGDARRDLVEAVLSTMVDEGEAAIPERDPRRTSLYEKMLRPPVVVAIVCAPSTTTKVVEHEELISTGIATYNMQLAARAEGVATYWTSGKKAFHAKVAAFLGLTPPARCLGFMYVGYPNVPWPEGERTPIADKVTWRR